MKEKVKFCLGMLGLLAVWTLMMWSICDLVVHVVTTILQ